MAWVDRDATAFFLSLGLICGLYWVDEGQEVSNLGEEKTRTVCLSCSLTEPTTCILLDAVRMICQ